MYKLLTNFFIITLINFLLFQPICAVAFEKNGSRTVEKAEKAKEIKKLKRVSKDRTTKDSKKSEVSRSDKKNNISSEKSSRKNKIKEETGGQSITRLPDGRQLLLGGYSEGIVSGLAVIKNEESNSTVTLQSELLFARAHHTATILPNGNVLILGGTGRDEKIVSTAEVFSPQTQQFTEVKINNWLVRRNHSATLLTSGFILIAGGLDNQGEIVSQIDLISAAGFEGQTVSVQMQESRYGHTASLLSDGTVFFQGGLSKNHIEINFNESFNPETRGFTITGDKSEPGKTEIPQITFSHPASGDSSVPTDVRPVIRFSKLLKVKTATDQTITLSGTKGIVPMRVIAAENGRLVFITPLEKLQPDTTYNIKLSGIIDENDVPLPETNLIFKTEEFCETPNTDQTPIIPHPQVNNEKLIIDEDSWIPGDDRFKRDKELKTENKKPPFLEAPAKVTALSGRILSLSDKPLMGVTLELQGQRAVTDEQGRFLITGLKGAQSGLVIHGETVNSPGKTFGTFEVLVDIEAEITNKLPFTVYLPVIDKQNEVSLDNLTAREAVVTSSRVPRMEVRIAPNSVLRMPSGHGMSHNLTDLTADHKMKKLGITPIPIERPPFPLPSGVEDGLLFTLQMHGARVEGPNGEKRPGLRFVFPNVLGQAPGTRVSFWNYDSTSSGWTWYGEGTVTKDGTTVVPDPGVELPGMQCLSLMTSGYAPLSSPAPGTHGYDGDPVDLQTGLFVHEQTDLVLPDTLPIKITRTYRQNDGLRDFGMGFMHPYNMFIYGDTGNSGSLILPDGGKIKFNRDYTRPNELIYNAHTDTPTAFYKAELRLLGTSEIDFNEGGWEVKMRDGTRLIFAKKAIQFNYVGIQKSITGLHQIIDRFGNKLTLTRDENLRLSRVISSNNKWVEFGYVGTSTIVSQIRDNIGRTVSYTYDTQNRLTKVTDAEGGESFYTYDSAHRMLTLKDARGIVNLTNEYDFAGRVKKQTSADGTIYQYAYTTESENSSKIIQTDVTNPRGLIRRMNFNDKGYPMSETFGVGRSDAWSYIYERETVSNRILSITDNWNQKTSFTYDEFGNMLTTKYLENTPNEITTSATYTGFDNVATATDSLNRTSNFVYDNKGLLTSAEDWLDREATFSYNEKGQLLTATDHLGRTSSFTYDSGTLIEAQDPTGRKTRRFVDGAGRATRVYDPMGGVTKYKFNKFNRPVEVTDRMGRTGALLHDAVGNILEITDSRGGKIKYTYDAMSRPLTRTNQIDQVETYQYDAYGNLWKATDFKGQITEFSYNVFNHPTLVKYHDNTTTSYSYDERGRISSLTDSVSGTITYGYDTHYRVNSETTVNGTISYAFDEGDRLVSMQAPNQPLVMYGYDTADRIQTITQDNQTVSFTYDDADRRSTMTLQNGITVYYTYDTSSQLKTLVYKFSSNILGDISFEYDGGGRRTHVSGSLAQILSPTPFDNTSYDASNKQTAVNSQTLTYDQNGNLTSDGTNTYTWNARDELIAMSGPNLTASFGYDGEGRRVSKTINGITTNYIYDGLQVVEENQQSGPVTTQLSGELDEVFFRKMTIGGSLQTEFLLTDALGSTWGLADQSGNINTQYKYDIFGTTQATGQSSTTNNLLQYTGRENDETGLYYYRNRYYSPSLRRFISRDPLKETAGENEYSYVNNSPTNFTDPLGLKPKIKTGRMVEGGLVPGRTISMKKAQQIRREGGNIITNTKRLARQVEVGAFKNNPSAGKMLHHQPHGKGFYPHYQSNNMSGHSFYGGKFRAVAGSVQVLNIAQGLVSDYERWH